MDVGKLRNGTDAIPGELSSIELSSIELNIESNDCYTGNQSLEMAKMIERRIHHSRALSENLGNAPKIFWMFLLITDK